MNLQHFDQLVAEANRCLLCRNPRCQQHCPIATPIPEIITLYKEGKLEEAGKRLFDNNPLSAICGIVCAHEEQCAGNCIVGIKGEPVKFYEIEQEVSRAYLEQVRFAKPVSNGKRVAVIGSGPAGLAVAFEMASAGFQVTIFEDNAQLGGILRYGIPDYRLPRDLIDLLEQHLLDLGVKIRYNTMIGPVLTIDRLLEDAYDAVFVGTGVWNPKTLSIPGETLGHVHYAIHYLKSPQSFHLGDKVAVIGAGNVAMDAARTAKRLGAKEVTILYRKDFDWMKATKAEIQETLEDGVTFTLYRAPKIIDETGLVTLESRKVEREDGSVDFQLIEGSELHHEADAILVAISQGPRNTLVNSTQELQANRWGLLVSDEDGHTTKAKVYACGDVVTGAKTVVDAVARAKRVAQTMQQELLEA